MKYINCHCGCGEKIPAINKLNKPARFKHGHNPRSRFKGRILRSNYWYIFKPEHPFSGEQGYMAEHRLIIEKKIGRYLTKKEVVHHINGDPQDNRIENLILFKTHGEHTKIAHPAVMEKLRQANIGRVPYNKGEKIIYKKICTWCKKEFQVFAKQNRKKMCSKKCNIAFQKTIKRTMNNGSFKKGIIPWNKGIPMTCQKRGKEHHRYKHGKYSQYAPTS